MKPNQKLASAGIEWCTLSFLCSILSLTAQTLPLNQIRYWAYQIQGVDSSGAVNRLAGSKYDMIVMEPTRTDWSSGPNPFNTAAAIAKIKASKAHDGKHSKLVLAYLDIGEAESWRWYWTWSKNWSTPRPIDWPAYITAPDPDGWSDNYPVLFWDPAWKDIVLYGRNTPATANRNFVSIVDEVLLDGFDGVYLDWVEAFSDPKVIAAANSAGIDPAVAMISFINEIRAYGRARNPNFVVIQQNAPDLILGHPELLQAIDAIAQESIWYQGSSDVAWSNSHGYDTPQSKTYTKHLLNWLTQYQNGGKPIFDIEYSLAFAPVSCTNSLSRKFVPYCSRTALSQLTTTPPPGY